MKKSYIALEILFYLIIVSTFFPEISGINQFDNLGGLLITSAGFLVLLFYYIKKEKLPKSFIFLLLINISANLIQYIGYKEPFIFGLGLPELFLCGWTFLMVSYLIKNDKIEKRVVLIASIIILVQISVSNIFLSDYQRLVLGSSAGGFADANRLAYVSGTFAILLIFYTIRAKLIRRVIYLIISGFLIYFCLRTASRGGIIALTLGLFLFLVSISLSSRFSKFRSRVVLVILFIIFLLFVINSIVDEINILNIRFADMHSYQKRLNVFSAGLWKDLNSTILLSMGSIGEYAKTSSGISAHNTFIYNHMVYGGLTAYIYLIWMFWLFIGIVKLIKDKAVSLIQKTRIISLGWILVITIFTSNMSYIFISSIFIIAMIDKSTKDYNRRIINLIKK